MKIVFDYNSKLEHSQKEFRNNFFKALEEQGNDLIRLEKRRLKKELDQKYKPDLYISFSLSQGKIKTRTVKCIVIPDEVELNRNNVNKLKMFERVIVYTKYKKLQLANKFGIEKEKIHVIYKSVEDSFDFSQIEDEERAVRRVLAIYRVNKPYIFLYSSLNEHSNIDKLIEAFSQIHQKYPDHKLLLASPEIKVGWDNKPEGETKRAKEIINLVLKSKAQRKVAFAGLIDDKHLPTVIRNAEISINLTDYDHFPRSLVEQLFSEACIMAADNTISKEILENAGHIVAPKHTASIVGGIKYLLDESEAREELRKKATKRSRTFRTENLYAEFIEVTKGILKKRSKERVAFFDLKQDDEKNQVSSFEKILELVFKIDNIKDEKYKTVSTFAKHVSKYRLLFVRGVIPRRWIVNLLVLRIFYRGTRIILIEGAAPEKSYWKRAVYNLVSNFIASEKYEFDFRFANDRKILTLPLKTGKEKGKLKLGNFTGISTGGGIDAKILTQVIKETYDYKCKYLVTDVLYEKLSESEIDSKHMKRVVEARVNEALATSKIYINFDKNISQEEVLSAFKHANICICLKTPNTINLIREGINGYLFNEVDVPRLSRQIEAIVDNKKHMRDMGKINSIYAGDFSFDAMKNEFKMLLNEL
ncbi:glycosyltransferase [Candidatus Dojkabacteria bacterium]|nr:glycosyltransferase [Candidatus Dojkabacteria bacterium]